MSLLACVGKESVVASQEVVTRIRDDELLVLVERLLGEAGWTYRDLTHVACVTGPGGFTSLRVAVAFANVLTDQLQIPLAGIHLSDLYRARLALSSQLSAGSCLWLHSTRRDSLFVRGGEWKEPTLVSLEAFEAEIHESPLQGGRWCGELLPEHETTVASRGLVPAELRNVIEILPSFLFTMSFEKRPLLPWYGRDG